VDKHPLALPAPVATPLNSHYWLSWKEIKRSEWTAFNVLMASGRLSVYTSEGDKPMNVILHL